MEVDCQPEESIVSSFDEDCVVLGDVKDMRLEAEAVVNDVLFAVSEMHVSQSLNSASDVAYINVETAEGNRFCLELTEAGLRVRRTEGQRSVASSPFPCTRLLSSLSKKNFLSLCLPGGRPRLQPGEGRPRHPVSRDCLLTSRHAESGLQRSFWQRSTSAARETETKWTVKEGSRGAENATRVVTSGKLTRCCGCIWVLANTNKVCSNIIACHVTPPASLPL